MSIAVQVAQHLPYLRRFARALTGSQAEGDDQVVRVLEALLADSSLLANDLPTKLALYRVFMRTRRDVIRHLKARQEDGKLSLAEARLSHLTPLSREAFLLTTVEEFSVEDAARILECSESSIRELVDQAGREITRQVATEVLIIEDEPMIALDIESIVQGLGHRVQGIARTHDESIALFRSGSPGLVLADIQLADGSSGLEAVNDLLRLRAVPVIFITSFPERLLTGERPEPTFLLTKPYQPEMVRATISQALFFDERSHASGPAPTNGSHMSQKA
ncbi:MAG: response regulator [Hyphomicrobiales bacterium]|nr:response regulator [Hyphomicrobiales bacterium]